jgi:hypothetical protein
VDPVPDPVLLRKSGTAGNRIQDLWICSQELWPLDHRVYNVSINPIIQSKTHVINGATPHARDSTVVHQRKRTSFLFPYWELHVWQWSCEKSWRMNSGVAVSNATEPTTTSCSHDNAFEFSLTLQTHATASDVQRSRMKTGTGCDKSWSG